MSEEVVDLQALREVPVMCLRFWHPTQQAMSRNPEFLEHWSQVTLTVESLFLPAQPVLLV